MHSDLAHWEQAGWIRPVKQSRRQTQKLLAKAASDLTLAEGHAVNDDWAYIIAYSAALEAAQAALGICGYRPAHEASHLRLIESLALTVGADDLLVRRFRGLRRKRHRFLYDGEVDITGRDIEEMLKVAREVCGLVQEWIRVHHPELVD